MATATITRPVTSTRIAALDGWRGIAILMVLQGHYWAWKHPQWGNCDGLGVTIFFVLSGYLITGNLLREMDNGGIQLRRFYLKRAFRLWPCSWTYQAAVLLLLFFATHHLFWRDALKCILFVRNFSGNTHFTGHFWSLSVEEQFYLVWPLTLVLFRKRAAWVAIAGIIFVGIFRATHWGIWTDHVHYFGAAATQFQADGLLAGCLAAMLKQRLGNVTLLAASIAVLLPIAIFQNYASHTAEIFAIGAGLLLTLQTPVLNRVFSFKPLTYLGLISYSLYVWQQFFLAIHLWGIIAAALCAAMSYRCIERPGIKLGARLMRH